MKALPKVIVRVKTSYYQRGRTFSESKDISFLRKKSEGFNFFEEDIKNIGVDLVLKNIINLHEVKDGVYQLIMVNEKIDWETGYIDSWDYKLIEYKGK